MDKIALVPQNEFQGAIRGAYDKYLEGGVSPEGTGGIANTQDVTNDKGLTVGKVSGNFVLHGFSSVAKHEIGAPSVPQGKVDGLLKNVVKTFNGDEQIIVDEREVARLQGNSDNAMQNAAFKQNEGAQKNSGVKFAEQLFSIRKNVSEMPNGTAASKIVSDVFKIASAFVGFVSALVTTIATGGGGVGALVAATMGLVSAITDVAGGYEKLQEKISEELQKNHPEKTKAECDEIAAYISMGIQVGLEIAETVISCKAPNPEKKLAGVIKQIKKSETVQSVIDKKIKDAALLIAKKAYGGNPTQAQIDKLIKNAEKIVAINEGFGYVQTVNKILGAVVNFGFQIADMIKADKRVETQVEFELTEADYEMVMNILADCGQDLIQTRKRGANNAGKIESILTSQSDAASSINEITSNIGG